MSVEHIGKELTGIINTTAEGAAVAADAANRTHVSRRIAALTGTLFEISTGELTSLIVTDTESSLRRGLEKFTEASDATRAAGINEEAALQICGALGNAKGYNDYRNPRNSGLHAALAEQRLTAEQLQAARGHIDAAVDILKTAAGTMLKAEEHITFAVAVSDNAIECVYQYAQEIGVQDMPPQPHS